MTMECNGDASLSIANANQFSSKDGPLLYYSYLQRVCAFWLVVTKWTFRSLNAPSVRERLIAMTASTSKDLLLHSCRPIRSVRNNS